MKRNFILILIASITAFSCVPYKTTTVRIKGIYPNAHTTEINGPIDEIWQNTITFLARYNFPMEIIDKNSHYIQTKELNIGPPTREKTENILKNPKNEFVGDFTITQYSATRKDSVNANDVFASYYVTFLVKDTNKATLIHGFTGIRPNYIGTTKFNVKSTGYFENLLEEYLKK